MSNHPTSPLASILLVEDSPPQAQKVKIALENNGCHVHWSETGLGGLAAAQQRPFDLIVLDIELPDINGFEVCQRLKADANLQDIPVVMLTTLDHAEHVMSGLDAGAVDYIPKDAFAESVLLETIRQMKQENGRG
ncbi:MAG: response regulator [Anaerolineae bacterium]|nr:response regulator [Anaerolineae bacterium]